MPNYWIIVGSPDNFEKTSSLGFTVQGMKTRQRRKAERMGDGDQFVWYITGEQAFAGYATITGPYFEDHDPVWVGKKDGEDYPWRVPIRKEVVLPVTGRIPAEGVARKLAYVAKWPPEHWRLAFQGNVHEISRADFDIVRAEIEKAATEAA
ncbi:MAG TPA: EVE domain-containing protein [Actinomycetota bacterium]|nr:EVE domain-containing protein [Actinomycetota bacterium]